MKGFFLKACCETCFTADRVQRPENALVLSGPRGGYCDNMQYICCRFRIVIDAAGELEGANGGSNASSQLNKQQVSVRESVEIMGGRIKK